MKSLFEKALRLDREDPLKEFRERFALPKDRIYLCNNSLGLPAKGAFTEVQNLMQCWAERGVEGWFQGPSNWYSSYDASLKRPLAHLLGAQEDEVTVMNSLTVNLHLLLVSFYQPKKERHKIVMEGPAFPSDLYAVKSHLKMHGFDPDEALILVEPRKGEHLLRQEDLEQILLDEGEAVALLFLNGVNFLTGQLLGMEALARLAKTKGCTVGFDLAHAAGNVPLQLHAWGIDFAVGCSYKYLCAGPGGPGIAYVHASHHNRVLPRFAGWWGNDPQKRFQMQLQAEFIPHGGAASWQVSTPSILGLMPLVASLAIYEEAGMEALRKKSELQTSFLMELLELVSHKVFEVITPKEPSQRGAQLSLLIPRKCEEVLKKLEERGVVCDFRPPNIIRVTPSALYNTFEEVYHFVSHLKEVLNDS